MLQLNINSDCQRTMNNPVPKHYEVMEYCIISYFGDGRRISGRGKNEKSRVTRYGDVTLVIVARNLNFRI